MNRLQKMLPVAVLVVALMGGLTPLARADELTSDEAVPVMEESVATEEEPIAAEEELAEEALTEDVALEDAADAELEVEVVEGESFAGHEGTSFRFQDGAPIPPDEDALQPMAQFVMWKKDSTGNYISSNGKPIDGALRRGVDVSEWNGTIDWAKAQADDVSFAIIRCGGTYWGSKKLYNDDEYERNVAECERLGIDWGVYFFSGAETVKQAEAEAAYTIKQLEGHDPSMPVYLDLEVEEIADRVSPATFAAIAKTYCDAIEAAGYTPGIYASLSWWETHLTDPVFDNWTRWVAQYYSRCEYEGPYRIWQSSGTARVDGISDGSGYVDMNFDFGKDDWLRPVSSSVWTRLWGQTALDTMAAVVQQGWKSSNAAVLATAGGYWDALSASALAGKYNCPVLLTSKTSLSSVTASELKRLGVKTVYIVGGPAAITEDVEAQVKALGCKTVRVAGTTAADTSREVAKALGSDHAKTCFVATSRGYWDALSASPIAYAKHMPIFLTEYSTGELSSETLAAIKAGGYTTVVICGGEAAVPASVKTQLEGIGVKTVARKWGNTAHETSTAVAKYGLELGMSVDEMGVATSNGYWDALTGAALCGRNGAVIVLVSSTNRSAVDAFVKPNLASISQGYIFGGTAAVTVSSWNYLVAVTG